jgi:hypothetical protein
MRSRKNKSYVFVLGILWLIGCLPVVYADTWWWAAKGTGYYPIVPWDVVQIPDNSTESEQAASLAFANKYCNDVVLAQDPNACLIEPGVSNYNNTPLCGYHPGCTSSNAVIQIAIQPHVCADGEEAIYQNGGLVCVSAPPPPEPPTELPKSANKNIGQPSDCPSPFVAK